MPPRQNDFRGRPGGPARAAGHGRSGPPGPTGAAPRGPTRLSQGPPTRSTPVDPKRTWPHVDRRRKSFLRRLFSMPLSPERIEARARARVAPVSRRFSAMVPVLFVLAALAAAGVTIAAVWSARPPALVPRHRAEALCFALAAPPAFRPSMRIEPSVALQPTRLSPATPPGEVLQQTMGYTDEMIVGRQTRRVGDFDVAIVWLRLADAGAPQHWLILAWMEGSDLAVCNFRFAGDAYVLSSEQKRWGRRIVERVLVEENFRADELPRVTFRAREGSLPTFGPS